MNFFTIVSRSPSPEPIYNSEGKRLNTREFRTRKKFEDERHSLIVKMMSINATYKPPSDYKFVSIDIFFITKTNRIFFLQATTN